MNLNQIEWFCYAYEMRSFAKASERSSVSRQAFGKSIKGLEEEMGAPLFVRRASGVEPTELAEDIYPKAKRCLGDYREILETCDEYLMSRRQKIRLALADGIADALPDDFLDDLERENPYAEVLIEKHFVNRCLELLHKGQTDFVICADVPEGPELKRISLVEYPIYVAVSRALIDFSPAECTLGSLARLVFFVLGDDFPSTQAFVDCFRTQGIEPRTNCQYADYDIILKEVRRGHGATVVPENLISRVADDDLAVFPFPDDSYRWSIGFYYLESVHSATEQRLIDFMRRHSLTDD